MEQLNLAKIFKALANEQRLKLFLLLVKQTKDASPKDANGCCDGVEKAFTKACECLNLSKATISHHFKELQNSGLIQCERKGQSFVCHINRKAVDAVRKFLG